MLNFIQPCDGKINGRSNKTSWFSQVYSTKSFIFPRFDSSKDTDWILCYNKKSIIRAAENIFLFWRKGNHLKNRII